MTKARSPKKRATKDKPLTHAQVSAKVEFKNADRMNLLDELAKRPHDFTTAAKYGPVWDALLSDWDWDSMSLGPADFGAVPNETGKVWAFTSEEEKKKHAEHVKAQEKTSKEWTDLTLSREALKATRDFIKEKLEEEEPKEGPDLRWRGLVALDMRRLYDRLQFIVEGSE